jgi:hypothetical protein
MTELGGCRSRLVGCMAVVGWSGAGLRRSRVQIVGSMAGLRRYRTELRGSKPELG